MADNRKLYEDLIKEALPESLTEYISNYDDYHYGWYIAPVPSTMILFLVGMQNEFYLYVHKYEMILHTKELMNKKLFSGGVPACEDGPDFDFIQKILTNYKLF